MNNQTITITYGDQAENHVGMQKIGNLANSGFTLDELQIIQKRFVKDCETEIIRLNNYLNFEYAIDDAYILIIRGGVNAILKDIDKTAFDMYEEQSILDVDKKAFMCGRVVNKNARYNLCFSKNSQEPDYVNMKGRIIAFSDVPITNYVKEKLNEFREDVELQAEGNYYYDISKCGIGFHGDAERRIVIGVRLGASMPLHYQWFSKSKPIGRRCKLQINHGDIYFMSEKATGYDWKKTKSITVRHAAGADKYLTTK